jgi:hypothetical protein
MKLGDKLAQKGRKGDTKIGHLTTGEVIIPAEVMASVPGLAEMVSRAFKAAGADIGQYTVGGGDDSVNPATAMPEYAWNEESQADIGTDSGYSMDDSGFSGGNNNDGDRDYYNQPVDRSPVPGWSPTPGQNSPRSIIGNEPSEIGGGYASVFGVSPAQYRNPMTGQTNLGLGFNPASFLGGVGGFLLGGPLGGMAGSMLGKNMAKTRFSFPDTSDTGPREPNNSDNNSDDDRTAARQPTSTPSTTVTPPVLPLTAEQRRRRALARSPVSTTETLLGA